MYYQHVPQNPSADIDNKFLSDGVEVLESNKTRLAYGSRCLLLVLAICTSIIIFSSVSLIKFKNSLYLDLQSSNKTTATPLNGTDSVVLNIARKRITRLKLLICQYGNFCGSDFDCIPGNKCIFLDLHNSQCLPDPSTYLNNSLVPCILSGESCSSDSICCDPGSSCNKNQFCATMQPPQCAYPISFAPTPSPAAFIQLDDDAFTNRTIPPYFSAPVTLTFSPSLSPSTIVPSYEPTATEFPSSSPSTATPSPSSSPSLNTLFICLRVWQSLHDAERTLQSDPMQVKSSACVPTWNSASLKLEQAEWRASSKLYFIN